MTPARLLDDLKRLGVHLAVEGNHLKVDAPKGAATPEILNELRAYKAEVIDTLIGTDRWGDDLPFVRWFLSSKPPSEPFELCPAVTVLDPARWWESIRVDIAVGPGRGRAHYGALEKDLRRLAELYGGSGRLA